MQESSLIPLFRFLDRKLWFLVLIDDQIKFWGGPMVTLFRLAPVVFPATPFTFPILSPSFTFHLLIFHLDFLLIMDILYVSLIN